MPSVPDMHPLDILPSSSMTGTSVVYPASEWPSFGKLINLQCPYLNMNKEREFAPS